MTKTDRRLTARDYRSCAKIGMTQAQTARALGVTREAVRQYAKKWGIEFRSGKTMEQGREKFIWTIGWGAVRH